MYVWFHCSKCVWKYEFTTCTKWSMMSFLSQKPARRAAIRISTHALVVDEGKHPSNTWQHFQTGIPILNASLLQDAQSEHLQGLGPSRCLVSTFRNGGLQNISSVAPKTERRTSAARSEPRRAPWPPVTEPRSCGCWRGTPEQGINPITPPPASNLTHFRLFCNLSLFGSSWLVLSVFNAS